MASYPRALLILCLATSLFSALSALQSPESPTQGCTSQPLNYKIQKPYDVSEQDRYSFVDGVHKFWVFDNDKPFKKDTTTNPRTELRVEESYSEGTWQFEGDVRVPSGTSGVCVMQIHPRDGHTDTMLRVYGGDLEFYGAQALASGIYGRWVHVNVVHDVAAHAVTHYVDGKMVLRHDVAPIPHAGFYFKCGVYMQNNASHCMESQWTNITIWKC